MFIGEGPGRLSNMATNPDARTKVTDAGKGQFLAGLRPYVRPFKAPLDRWRLHRALLRRFPAPAPRPHGLPGELIVSLTSFPPRFGVLALTLESLMRQTIAADRIVLWIAETDRDRLPRAILADPRLTVEFVPDIRSYKKLIFALDAFPQAYIATADDDVFYPPDWLEALVSGQSDERAVITYHRGHRMVREPDGRLAPYLRWEWDVQDARARRPSRDILPTGVGGILYPPGVLHPDVTDQAIFTRLCPTADDLWFYWMARRAGALYKKVGPPFELVVWPVATAVDLATANMTDNDVQIDRLIERYGFAPDMSPRDDMDLRQGSKR
jgi:hypothetical protein